MLQRTARLDKLVGRHRCVDGGDVRNFREEYKYEYEYE
jgi:hypothetical protein